MKIKYLLFCSLCLIIFLLLYFSFWNFPAMDDYIVWYLHQHLGFWGTQKWIYNHNSGRYFSSLLGAVFSQKNFLYHHYYLHSLILIPATILSYYWLLRNITLHLHQQISRFSILLYSLLFFFLALSTCPEVASKYYWFSAAVTYQSANILILLITGSLLNACFAEKSSSRNFFTFLSCLLIILLNGTNEISALMFFLLLMPAILLLKKYRLLTFSQLILVLICAAASLCFLIFSPGIFQRKSTIPSHGILTAFGATFFWLCAACWYIIKVPFFWLMIICLNNFGRNIKADSPIGKLFSKLNEISWIKIFIVIAVAVYLAILPIAYGMNGSLPHRALNNIVFILLLIFCLLAFYLGYQFKQPYLLVNKYKYILFILLIFGNSFFFNLVQTTLSGYFYQQVIHHKLAVLESARENGLHSVQINDYETSLDSLLEDKYHDRIKVVIRKIISEKPSLLYMKNMNNDYITNSFLLNYYYLDSLTVGQEVFTKSH